MKATSPLVVGLAAGAMLLAGCGSDDGGGSPAGTPTVVASAYPFAFVAERVGGDLADVENLTSPGFEPHDIELAPQQLAAVQDADVVLYESSFQPAVDDAIEQSGLSDDALLDVADVAPLEDTGAEVHEEGEEHEGEEHEGEEHSDEAALDPHVWLDPQHMVEITDAVTDQLVAVDPDDAEAYQANADALVEELTVLDRDFEQSLGDCERSTVVTSHDAFRYLGMRYDLDMVPIAGLDPTQEPSPAAQAEIADTVEAEGVTTIFTEELVSPAVAESIADETGAQTAILSPIEGLSDDTSDEDYLSLMRANLAALQEANGCT